MTPEQFARVERLFDAACALPEAERTAFVAREATDDPEVLAALRGLLAEDVRSGRGSEAFAGVLHAVRATARSAPGGLLPARIGPFEIIRLIGKGGMGVVYEAEQAHSHRRVALKVVRDAEFVDPVQVRMFEREAEALARLRHPNIAAVYESGRTEEGRPYFAMELVQGETLDAHLRARPELASDAELRARLRIFATVAGAVHYAHQRGVIHRDLKPANIMVAPGGTAGGGPEIKILDFGLARIVDVERQAASLLTEVGVIKGTLPYMSPEQARGRSDEIDVRTDVYSLGVILYEMLAGVRPYSLEHAAIAEVLRVICEQTPPPLHKTTVRGTTTRFRLDADLDTIVQKALAKEADRRYGSAQALADDVERFLASQPIAARAPSAAYQIRKLFQRHRAAFAMGASALAALVAATVVSTAMYFRAERASVRAGVAAAKSAATARFLDETLQAAGPSVALGRDASMLRDILDRAASRIEVELRGQDEVEAFVRTSIGGTYTSLGRYGEAARQLEAALTLHDALAAPLPEERAKLLTNLGTLRWLAGHPQDAEPLFRQALAIRKDLFGPDHADVANSMTDLGNVIVDQNRLDEAQPLLEEALALRERVLGPRAQATAISVNSLANLLHHRGELPRAEELYRRALGVEEEVLGRLHPDTITTRSNLGLVLRKRGAWPESSRVLDEALQDARSAYGERHPRTARAMMQAAGAKRMVGELAEAERLGREALALLRTLHEPGSVDVGYAITDLAAILEARDLLDEAEALFREALAVHRAAGSLPASIASALGNLATLLARRNRFGEALPLQEESLRMEEQRLGADHPTVFLLRNNLGRLQRSMGALAAAEQTFTAVVADRRRVLGEKDPAVATSLHDLGLTLDLLGDTARSRTVLVEAHAIAKAAWTDAHVGTATIATSLARALFDAGEPAAAEPVLRAALPVLAKAHGATNSRVVSTEAALARTLAALGRTAEVDELCARIDASLGDNTDALLLRAQTARLLARHAEAEALAVRAHAALSASVGEAHPRTQEAVAELVAIFAAWEAAAPGQGKAEAAAAWRAKLR